MHVTFLEQGRKGEEKIRKDFQFFLTSYPIVIDVSCRESSYINLSFIFLEK